MSALMICWMEIIEQLTFCYQMQRWDCTVGCSGIGKGVGGRTVIGCHPVHWDSTNKQVGGFNHLAERMEEGGSQLCSSSSCRSLGSVGWKVNGTAGAMIENPLSLLRFLIRNHLLYLLLLLLKF